MTRTQHNGAEALLHAGSAAGIEVCFANPGTSEMQLVGGLDSDGNKVRPVLCLHETVCTGAADGYGRMANKPAMTLLHLGPGLANGLANLHNANRASSPVVNVVGDMATWHKAADPLLNMDIEALAKTVSKHVKTSASSETLGADMLEACQATKAAASVMGPRISTLIVPHDCSWSPAPAFQDDSSVQNGEQPAWCPAASDFLKDCAAALKACPKGKAALLLGGRALLKEGRALENAGRVAAATGAALLCEQAFTRMERGAGLPCPERVPYFPQEQLKALAAYEVLVIIDTRRPVAMFGYKDGPSQLVTQPDDNVWEIDDTTISIPEALAMLSKETGGDAVVPLTDCGGVFCGPKRHPLPKGKLTAATMGGVIAALQPEGTILVDESLTSGAGYWEASKGAPGFSHLTITGGAIGCGPPLAIGAAVACPDRTVINLQADGSAMYSVQALWTQARENLKVITIICANRIYGILKVEFARQKAGNMNGKHASALMDIGHPSIEWVHLAKGMGVQHAYQARTVEELAAQLTDALARDGPTLIEAVI